MQIRSVILQHIKCTLQHDEVNIVIMFVRTCNFWFEWCIHKCGDCVHDVSSYWLNLQNVFVSVAIEISNWFKKFWMVIGQHLKLQFFIGKKKWQWRIIHDQTAFECLRSRWEYATHFESWLLCHLMFLRS